MKQIIFICGVNGVGKSAIIPYLKDLLAENKYRIHDFDERGVPANAGDEWRVSETKYWLKQAAKYYKQGLITIVCGFIEVDDFLEAKADIGSTIQCVLLDADPDSIRSRLSNRYTKNNFFDPDQTVIGKPIQQFIEGNVYIRNKLKLSFENLGCPVVDTSYLKPEEVVQKVIKILNKI